jgi:dipeptidyl aminopeptidase/acylaminoacyl peptidase
MDGTRLLTLSCADVSGLDELELPRVEPFTVPAADGVTELHGVLYLPPGFDPAGSYPVIESQYGGPQAVVHPVTFAGGVDQMAYARAGFVVVTVDGRGTPARGKAFQDVAYGRFHEYHVEDHAHALRQLLERTPFMDPDRVGVVGGSWGGYGAVRLLLLAPDLYKVGVAMCPVYDFDDHTATAIEPYMGLPADRPDAFRAGSSIAMADRLEGRLLIIHGTSDVNATFSATMKMCEALARADKPYDLVVLPGADHGFRAGDLDQNRYVRAATIRYFLEHLRPEPR